MYAINPSIPFSAIKFCPPPPPVGNIKIVMKEAADKLRLLLFPAF
jgi:hypothetical protein